MPLSQHFKPDEQPEGYRCHHPRRRPTASTRCRCARRYAVTGSEYRVNSLDLDPTFCDWRAPEAADLREVLSRNQSTYGSLACIGLDGEYGYAYLHL